MNRKIWKALGIAVCMLALAAPRAMAETKVHMVTAKTDLVKLFEEINKTGDDDENVIELHENITLTDNYKLYNCKTTTIKGEGHTIFVEPNAGITVTGKGNVLNLGAKDYKGTLTIGGKTSGGSASGNAKNAFVSVLERATANMYENVTLQNGEFAGNACVVVKGLKLVTGPNSAFNMYGGVIEKCSRAVIVDSGATFNMSRGEIRNCGGGRGSGNGGGVRVYEATFVMSDGTISGCSADTGGGLCAEKSSTVTISGGTISGCKALSSDKGNGGGLYVEDSTLTIERGTISRCTARNNGGGLYATNSSTNSSTVTISGGTISGCTASKGGGLYADNSTIEISGGVISGCKEIGAGGGLYVVGSTVTISGGAISECSAANDGGGLYADNSTITINKGTISGCDGRWGGGLYAEKKSTITITGGTISRCEVGAGGGLFVDSSTIRISGGIISECTTSDTGNGGGLYAKNSTIKITGGTIENNKAAHGGVALIGDTTFEKPITNWTVIGNEAYATGGVGGGIKLENGSMDVSDGFNRIYNNTAGGQGADIFLLDGNASIKLPIAANMNVNYHDSGIKIDNWYNDNPRYTPSESGAVVEANKLLNGGLSLVASYKASPVHIEINANGGVGGSGSQTVQKGTTVTLEAPTKEGHLFKGWKDGKGNSYPAGEDGKVKITANDDMTLTAVWEARSFTVTYVLLDGKTRTETAAYGQNVTLVEEPRTGYTFVGWKDGENVYHAGETITVTGDVTLTAEWKKLPSAENLPKTGDESPVLLWGAALAVSAAACFMLRRRK